MRISAKQVGCIHIVGIGGIGMSGIAEVLNSMGYQVQGSDIKDNANIKRLRAQGLKIFLNQKPENIKNAKVLVLSSAIADDNPEVIAAHADNKPVIRRVDMLCEIMAMKPSIAVSGSHGKTTTTSLTAAAMDVLGLCPTVISGGIINTYKTNAKLGTGQWIVVEADESDGTLTKLPARIAVITNIDEEHLDYYGSFHNLQQAFLWMDVEACQQSLFWGSVLEEEAPNPILLPIAKRFDSPFPGQHFVHAAREERLSIKQQVTEETSHILQTQPHRQDAFVLKCTKIGKRQLLSHIKIVGV